MKWCTSSHSYKFCTYPKVIDKIWLVLKKCCLLNMARDFFWNACLIQKTQHFKCYLAKPIAEKQTHTGAGLIMNQVMVSAVECLPNHSGLLLFSLETSLHINPFLVHKWCNSNITKIPVQIWSEGNCYFSIHKCQHWHCYVSMMWICNQRTIGNIAYVFVSNRSFLDTCK